MEASTSLTSWQQAFEDYPLATTRTIEKQLRTNATHNREKLRGLVGGNYRELLATADGIISLSSNSKQVEINITELGQQCKPPPGNGGRSTASQRPPKAFIGELRLLQRCASTAHSALDRLDFLQCGQLIVVSRLLHKSLSEHEIRLKTLDDLRDRTAFIRRHLLRVVDAYFLNASTTISDLIPALCGFCLVTSNSADEAVNHVKRLRLQKLREVLEHDDLPRLHIVQGLRYQTSTLQVLKLLYGRTLNDALAAIQKRAILDDPGLQQLETLALDSARTVIRGDIFAFVPYFKRSQLTSTEIEQELEVWSGQACAILCEGLSKYLKHQYDTSEVLLLRRELFSCLLPVYFSVPGQARTSKNIEHELSSHLERLLERLVGKLEDITSRVMNTSLSSALPGSLWSEDVAKASVSSGGTAFLRKLQSGRAGIDVSTGAVVRLLEMWIKSIRGTTAQFENLKIIRWNDILEEPEEEQEEAAAKVIKALSQEQPVLYQNQLRSMLNHSIEEFENAFRKCATGCVDNASNVNQSISLIRLIRLTMIPLHEAFPDAARTSKVQEYLPQLHEHVAREVVKRLAVVAPTSGLTSSASVPDKLPSPRAFFTLRSISSIMSEMGGIDLWSTMAVDAVKKEIAAHIFGQKHTARYIQNSFDKMYLGTALGTELLDEGGDLDASQIKAAQDYWNRTKVLFGVLA